MKIERITTSIHYYLICLPFIDDPFSTRTIVVRT
jgi:hypothetical protein